MCPVGYGERSDSETNEKGYNRMLGKYLQEFNTNLTFRNLISDVLARKMIVNLMMDIFNIQVLTKSRLGVKLMQNSNFLRYHRVQWS